MEKDWIGVESFTILRNLEGHPGLVLGGVWEIDRVYRGQQDGQELQDAEGERKTKARKEAVESNGFRTVVCSECRRRVAFPDDRFCRNCGKEFET